MRIAGLRYRPFPAFALRHASEGEIEQATDYHRLTPKSIFCHGCVLWVGLAVRTHCTGALAGFEEGRFRVLVATDIASRGIHVDNIAHVINYDLPAIPEDFIHRVGRTGRAGLMGRASTLVAGGEIIELRHIERALKLKIVRKQIGTEGVSNMPSLRPQRSSLPSRTLTRLPGEVFV